MPISIHKELRHRGQPLVEYPGADLCKTVGGKGGVAALIEDLDRRIAQNELLRVAFPHFNTQDATSFFLQWSAAAAAIRTLLPEAYAITLARMRR